VITSKGLGTDSWRSRRKYIS